MILAIDPGTIQSAYVIADKADYKPYECGKLRNDSLLAKIHTDFAGVYEVVIEQFASYGMPVGAEAFETVRWAGRFEEAAIIQGCHVTRIPRMEVKMHLCHSSRAKDGNVRQALIDRFGGVGTKRAPGWFYGFYADIWQCYALLVCYADKTAQRVMAL